MKSHFSITVAVQYFEIAFDVSPRRRKDSVEGLICIYNHRDDLNAINNSITISIVSIQDPPSHALGALSVGESRVDEDGVVALRLRAVNGGVAGLV